MKKIKGKEIDKFVETVALANALFGSDFLIWVMDNIETLMKDYEKHYIKRKK